jgi:ABC-type lipoprotein export system ATPase subunit
MIRVEHLTKQFRSGRGVVQALTDVTLSLEGGTATAIVGKSGSGKTTLLNIIGGLEQPDTGCVSCFGVKINALSKKELSLFLRKNIGFVFQHGNLLSYLSVFENIAFPLTLNGIVKKEKEKRVFELLEQIGLSEAAKALPPELSGGELQRVSIARAIAHHPKLLLADEPTASLDSATAWSLIELIFNLSKQQGCTVVFSTHDPEIVKLSDNNIRLKDGKMLGSQ